MAQAECAAALLGPEASENEDARDALLDAGVSDVTVLIDKNPKGKPDPVKGLPGEDQYSPTRGFGGEPASRPHSASFVEALGQQSEALRRIFPIYTGRDRIGGLLGGNATVHRLAPCRRSWCQKIAVRI